MEEKGTARAIRVLEAICDEVVRQKDYLCALDAALGDGDHGVSMAKSFGAVKDRLPELAGKDLGLVLNTVGMTLISEVGGAMGPLFGTAFIRAGRVAEGKEAIASADLAEMLAAAEQGIVRRGRAEVGDKTMLDALHPAVLAARRAADEGAGVADALQAAAAAAAGGAEATKDLVAKVGRASRLGERTLGHQDPGATSLSIILRVAADAL